MSQSITKSIIVKGSPSDLYSIWSNFEQFPSFMKHIQSIRMTDRDHSHWVMNGPLGYHFEWDAEVTRRDPDKRIAWRSIEQDSQSNMKTSGQVTFAELTDGETELTVTMLYVPPAGVVGEVVSTLFGDPDGQLEEDLRRFKTFAENLVQATYPNADSSADTKTPGEDAAMSDTTIKKVDSEHSPTGSMGQKYLASGTSIAMRLWEHEKPGEAKRMRSRPYETVGYVISGRAELYFTNQVLQLEPGDSWVVPKDADHMYKILEPFTAVEATHPPAHVGGRDQ